MESPGLTPLTFGMIGLIFALWGNGGQLLGWFPEKPEHPRTTATVGVAASLAGAITLIFMALWFVIRAPFGTEPAAAQVQLMFSAIPLMYGLLWLGAAITQVQGWDMRVIGQLALVCLFLQVTQMIVIALQFRPWTTDLTGIQVVLGSYVLVLAGFFLVTHGRTSPKWVGRVCILAAAGTAWLAFVPSGLIAMG